MERSSISMVLVAEGAEGQGVSVAPIPPSRKLLPRLSSPVGFRDPRPTFCPNVAKVLCVRMRFVPRSGLSPWLTDIDVSVGSTTGSLLQTEWSAFRICGPAASANAGGE